LSHSRAARLHTGAGRRYKQMISAFGG
jgi:hypothetical protein